MLERATPMFGVEAVELPGAAEPGAEATPASHEPSPPRSGVDAPDTTMRIRTQRGLPGSTPPSRALLVLAGLGATGLAIAAIVIFLRGRQAVLAGEDAGVRVDARGLPPLAADARDAGLDADAPGDAAPMLVIDAGPPPRDAAERPRDAQVAARPRDAEPAPHDARLDAPHDARLDARVDARPAGTATLRIGADPWGEIVIDGVRRGRTPARIEVSAGKHVVEVIFAGEDPPRRQTFPVELAAGATFDVVADFTRP